MVSKEMQRKCWGWASNINNFSIRKEDLFCNDYLITPLPQTMRDSTT